MSSINTAETKDKSLQLTCGYGQTCVVSVGHIDMEDGVWIGWCKHSQLVGEASFSNLAKPQADQVDLWIGRRREKLTLVRHHETNLLRPVGDKNLPQKVWEQFKNSNSSNKLCIRRLRL